MKLLFISLSLISFSCFAANKISSAEFIKKLDRGSIQFDIMPYARILVKSQLMGMMKTSDPEKIIGESGIRQLEQEYVKGEQAKYRFFNPEMLNVRYIDDGEWRYMVTFDYASSRRCILRTEKLDSKCGNPVCGTPSSPEELAKHPNVDINGVVIADKYCEQIYNVKIPK